MAVDRSLDKPGLSVVVMLYNEASTLAPVVRGVHDLLEKDGRQHELLIVDDGSTDGSKEVAAQLAQQLEQVRVLRHATNRGIGEVLRTGFSSAAHEYVTVVPADGQFQADNLLNMLARMDSNDLVLGYLPGRAGTWISRMFSGIERLIYFVLFGPMPRFLGLYMFRRSLLQKLPLTSEGRGWAIQMELIVRAQRAGCRIASVPTTVLDRAHGASKARTLRNICSNLRQVFSLWRALRKEAHAEGGGK